MERVCLCVKRKTYLQKEAALQSKQAGSLRCGRSIEAGSEACAAVEALKQAGCLRSEKA
jgi:hypothetical protein